MTKHPLLRQLTPDLLVIIPVLLSVFLYSPLIHSFFQGDEWWAIGFGLNQSYSHVFQSTSGGWTPLSNFLAMFLAKNFHINATPWALLSILSHTINVALLYWTVKNLSGRPWTATLSATFFAVMPADSQMVRVFALSLALPSITIMLTALWALSARRYRLGLFLAALSLFSSGYYATALLPPYFILFFYQYIRFPEDKRGIIIIGTLSLLLSLCYIYFITHLGLPSSAASLGDTSISLGQKLYQAFIARPVIALPQILWPTATISDVAFSLRQGWGILMITGIFLFVLSQTKTKDLARLVAFGLLWLIGSYLYFSIIRQVPLDSAIASRYLYLPSIGMAIILGVLVSWLIELKKPYLHLGLTLSLVCTGLVIHPWYTDTHKAIAQDVIIGQQRQQVLKEFKRLVPTIPEKTVLFISSNTGHFGVPPTVIPVDFLATFGYIATIVDYQNTPLQHRIVGDSSVAINPSLEWEIPIGTEFFGYVHGFESAKAMISKNNLPITSLIALYYDEPAGKMYDLSQRNQELIAWQSLTTAPVSNLRLAITTSDGRNLQVDNGAIIDPPIHLPLFDRPSITIDLGSIKPAIAGISLTTDEANSYIRQYEIEFSDDNKQWQKPASDGFPNTNTNTTAMIAVAPRAFRYAKITSTSVKEPNPFIWSTNQITVYEQVGESPSQQPK